MPLELMMPMWPAGNLDSLEQVSCAYDKVLCVLQAGFLCRSLGAVARCCAAFGQGTGQIVLDQLGCAGTETSLFNCPGNPVGNHDCRHTEDVGVVCRSKYLQVDKALKQTINKYYKGASVLTLLKELLSYLCILTCSCVCEW